VILLDVNVLVYAARREFVQHEIAHRWLTGVLSGPARWEVFAQLVRDLGLRANDVPDALLAATALHLNAGLATVDRGLRRFPR